MAKLRRLHLFLQQQAFYPLMLATLLSGIFFIGRVYLSRSRTFDYMVWNLFLAWIPYGCSLAVIYLYQRHPQRRWWLLAPALLWFIFFPNAPYMVTDLLHLRIRPPVPWWYDIGFLVTIILNGLFLGLVSLRIMQQLVERLSNWVMSWLFVLSVVSLSGFGIYLGRFLRWNSWDVLVNPDDIFYDVVVRVLYPRQHLQTYGVTLMFAALLFVCYLTFISMQPKQLPDPQNE